MTLVPGLRLVTRWYDPKYTLGAFADPGDLLEYISWIVPWDWATLRYDVDMVHHVPMRLREEKQSPPCMNKELQSRSKDASRAGLGDVTGDAGTEPGAGDVTGDVDTEPGPGDVTGDAGTEPGAGVVTVESCLEPGRGVIFGVADKESVPMCEISKLTAASRVSFASTVGPLSLTLSGASLARLAGKQADLLRSIKSRVSSVAALQT